MDVAQQRVARAIEEGVDGGELRPALQREVERVRVLEPLRRPVRTRASSSLAEIAEEPVRDVRVAELVLDDGEEEIWLLRLGACSSAVHSTAALTNSVSPLTTSVSRRARR